MPVFRNSTVNRDNIQLTDPNRYLGPRQPHRHLSAPPVPEHGPPTFRRIEVAPAKSAEPDLPERFERADKVDVG